MGEADMEASLDDAAPHAGTNKPDAGAAAAPPPPVRDAGPPRCTPRTACIKTYNWALQQWFIIGLGVAIAFAAAVPRLGATGGYIRAEYSVKLPAIIIIFIISGLGLKTKALLTAMGDLRIHLLVQGLSLAAIPALGYAIALGLRAGSFDPHLADGLVIMACMPTTVSTNVVYTQRAAGNEPAALVNAVLGNIIGIFITPLWLSHFLSVSGAAPYTAVLLELSYTIVAPLIVGQLAQYWAPAAVRRRHLAQVAWVKGRVNLANASSCCILALVWLTFCNTFAGGVAGSVPGRDVAGVVFLDVALFFLFVALCFAVAWPPPPLAAARRLLRLRRADAVAVVICGSTKTVALGVPLINVMYKNVPYAGLLALPLIIYHALQVLLGGLMLGPLKKWCLAGGDGDAGAQQAASVQGAAGGGSAGSGPPALPVVADGHSGSGRSSGAHWLPPVPRRSLGSFGQHGRDGAPAGGGDTRSKDVAANSPGSAAA